MNQSNDITTELIMNGASFGGSIASQLIKAGGDFGVFRPWLHKGQSYANIGGKTVPVRNENTLLSKDQWIELDTAITGVAKERRGIVQDLLNAGLSYQVRGGMAKTVFESQTRTDVTAAKRSMLASAESENDRNEISLEGVPLFITSKDFFLDAREFPQMRESGLDASLAMDAAERVVEEVEKATLGISTAFTHGAYTAYGVTNWTSRLTATINAPTESGWTPNTLVDNVLAMRQKAINDFHRGPYVLYHGGAWDEYLDGDYKNGTDLSTTSTTLRRRIEMIEGITAVRANDFLSGYTLILVEQRTRTIRMINAMDLTTIQWESKGGMQVNFKVMAIQVPQLRADTNSNTGIVHGSV